MTSGGNGESGRKPGAEPGRQETESESARPSARAPWLFFASFALIVLLLLGGVLWMAENPSSMIYKAFIATAELTIPSQRSETDEYLVFLTDDTEANRKRLSEASPLAAYVSDSFLPGVVVVKIPDQVEASLASLNDQEFVKLVMKYNPAFGCH